MSSTRLFLLAGATLVAAGCSFNTETFLPDKSVEYKKEQRAERGLEIPPDLSSTALGAGLAGGDIGSSEPTTYSGFKESRRLGGQRARSATVVLPEIDNVELMRDGDQRWLVINAEPDAVWQNVVEFWQNNGVLLAEQDPLLGIMRTSWLENRANLSKDLITNTLSKYVGGLYETGFRDQYRVRLERGGRPGQTELYLTHYAMQEKLASGTSGEADRAIWVPAERNPELEQIMLRQLMIHLGIAEQQVAGLTATQKPRGKARAQLVESDEAVRLLINEDLSRSWRLAGIALDRVGFVVEDRDRQQNMYLVRYFDPAAETKDDSWLSSLAFWRSDKVDKEGLYQVKLTPTDAGTTDVVVLTEQGERDNSETARRILRLMEEQLR